MSEKPLRKLTRRDMLKLSGTVAAGAVLASCSSPTPEPTEEAKPEEPAEEVTEEPPARPRNRPPKPQPPSKMSRWQNRKPPRLLGMWSACTSCMSSPKIMSTNSRKRTLVSPSKWLMVRILPASSPCMLLARPRISTACRPPLCQRSWRVACCWT